MALRKKKIIVFGNGWNGENLYHFLHGLTESAPKDSVDVFVFLSYSTYGYSPEHQKSEALIYDLPDLSTFDGAIIYGPGLNFSDVIEHIYTKVVESGIPAVSIGLKYPGMGYIAPDNYSGMKDLCDHIIEKHDVKNIAFIAGSRENDDSNIRIQAVRDSMAEHGLSLKPSDIFYSNWEVYVSQDYLKKRLRSQDDKPDAIVCANDQLAIYASLLIEEFMLDEKEIPIITGFDYLAEGQLFYPSIASVDQQYDFCGRKALELLFAIQAGNATEMECAVPCVFRPAESCGCPDCSDPEKIRHHYARNIPRRNNSGSRSESRMHWIEHAILSSENFRDLPNKLQELVYERPGAEGQTLYIMMDELTEYIADDKADRLPEYKYCDEFEVIVAKKDNLPIQTLKCKRTELIPEYESYGANTLYVFCPLYYESFACGYIVLGDQLEWINDHFNQTFQSRFNRTLISYRRNLQLNALNARLAEIMEQDPLTSVKNRTAFERFSRMCEEKIKNHQEEPFGIVFFDINNLKLVNDRLGHEEGDKYIKNSTKFICHAFKHSPIFRVGGDEFIAYAEGEDYRDCEKILDYMNKRMEEIKLDGESVPANARISIASGIAKFNRETDATFASVVKRADTLMYENKKIMKNGNVR